MFYHSGWQKVFINAKGLKGRTYTLQVFDVIGKLIFTEHGKLDSEYYTRDLPVQNFSNGLYIVSLQTEKEKLVKRFVRE